MELNDLIKLAQTFTQNAQSNNQSNTNETATNTNQQVDFSNNYFKNQYPSPIINEELNNIKQEQKTYIQTNSNTSGTLSQSYVSPNANNYSKASANTQQETNMQQNNNSSLLNSTNNTNLMSTLQNILPLLNSQNGNNLLSNLFSSNKKNSTQGTEYEENTLDDINIDELIKIDDT